MDFNGRLSSICRPSSSSRRSKSKELCRWGHQNVTTAAIWRHLESITKQISRQLGNIAGSDQKSHFSSSRTRPHHLAKAFYRTRRNEVHFNSHRSGMDLASFKAFIETLQVLHRDRGTGYFSDQSRRSRMGRAILSTLSELDRSSCKLGKYTEDLGFGIWHSTFDITKSTK